MSARVGLALALAEEARVGADAPEVPAAEPEARDLESGAAERAEFHGRILADDHVRRADIT